MLDELYLLKKKNVTCTIYNQISMVNLDRTCYYNSCSLTIVHAVRGILATGNPELSKHVKIIVMIMIYDI